MNEDLKHMREPISEDHGAQKKGFNMFYDVLYYDASISEDELQLFQVEANDAYQAEEYFKQFIRDMSGIEIYSIGSSEPVDEDSCQEPDAHSCSAEADEFGCCTVCGAIVHGSLADYELHGYDPPDTY